MLKTCAPMTFPDFQRHMECARVIFKTFAESLYTKNCGTILPMVTECVTNFGHLTTSIFLCDLKCKTCLTEYDQRNLICQAPSYPMTWYEEKMDRTRAWRFIRTNRKSHV